MEIFVNNSPPFSAWKVLAFFLGALPLCYIPTLVTPYALSDDYTQLFEIRSGAKWPLELRIAGGRPVHAFLTDFFYHCTRDIGGLRYLRLLTVIIVAFLAWCLYRAMLSTGWDWRQSIMIALMVVTLPPFQVYVSWAETASYPLAALTAAAAFHLAEVSLQARRTRQKWGLAAASIFVILLALTNFQPGAMFFWVFAALVMLKSDTTAAFAMRHLLWYGGIVGAGLVLAFGVYKLGMTKYGFLLPPTRLHLTANLTDKALWFFRSPLLDALNLAGLSPSPWIAAFVAPSVSIGMILDFQGGITERLWKYAVALSLIPLSYLPNLMVAEDWSSYRSQVALTSLILVYTCFALRGYVRLLHVRIADRVLSVVLSVSALTTVFVASYNVDTYFALPQSLELRLMRSQLTSKNLAQIRSIYVIGATGRDSIAPTVRYDEFGLPFSAQPWAPGPAAHLLLRESSLARSKIPVEVAPLGGPIEPPNGALVVDMRKLADFR